MDEQVVPEEVQKAGGAKPTVENESIWRSYTYVLFTNP